MNSWTHYLFSMLSFCLWLVVLSAERFFGWPIVSLWVLYWLFKHQWSDGFRPIGYLLAVLALALSYALPFFISGCILLALILSGLVPARYQNLIGISASTILAILIGYIAGINPSIYSVWVVLTIGLGLFWLFKKLLIK